jgi:hypothetical protein
MQAEEQRKRMREEDLPLSYIVGSGRREGKSSSEPSSLQGRGYLGNCHRSWGLFFRLLVLCKECVEE